MAFHFLTGFFGSPILAMGGTTIADLYALKKRAYSTTLWGVFTTCAPSLGPLPRSFSACFEGLALDDLGAHVALFRNICPALLPRNLHIQHPLPPSAHCLRKSTGNPSIMSAPEIVVAAMSRHGRAIEILVRRFGAQLSAADYIRSQCLHRPHLRRSPHLVRSLPSCLYRYLPLKGATPRAVLPWPFCWRVRRHATLLRPLVLRA
jgi:MFS family permease